MKWTDRWFVCIAVSLSKNLGGRVPRSPEVDPSTLTLNRIVIELAWYFHVWFVVDGGKYPPVAVVCRRFVVVCVLRNKQLHVSLSLRWRLGWEQLNSTLVFRTAIAIACLLVRTAICSIHFSANAAYRKRSSASSRNCTYVTNTRVAWKRRRWVFEWIKGRRWRRHRE